MSYIVQYPALGIGGDRKTDSVLTAPGAVGREMVGSMVSTRLQGLSLCQAAMLLGLAYCLQGFQLGLSKEHAFAPV